MHLWFAAQPWRWHYRTRRLPWRIHECRMPRRRGKSPQPRILHERKASVLNELDIELDGDFVAHGNAAGFHYGIIEDAELFAAQFGRREHADLDAVLGVLDRRCRGLEI